MKKGSRSLMMCVFKIKQSSMLKIGVPEEKEKEKSTEKIFDKILDKPAKID